MTQLNLIKRIADWIVDHPKWNILFLMVTTLVAAMGYYDPSWLWPRSEDESPAKTQTTSSSSASTSSATPANAPTRSSQQSRRAVAINQADVVVVATSDHFFTPAGAAAIRDVVESLEAEPTVDNVLWLDRAPPLNVFGLPEPIFPRTDASPQRFAAAKKKAQEHPLIVGQLMSADTRHCYCW